MELIPIVIIYTTLHMGIDTGVLTVRPSTTAIIGEKG